MLTNKTTTTMAPNLIFFHASSIDCEDFCVPQKELYFLTYNKSKHQTNLKLCIQQKIPWLGPRNFVKKNFAPMLSVLW